MTPSPITAAIRAARNEGRAALIPYFMLGFPTLPDSIACIRAAADAGADIIEIGVPFSDPLADGPVIQAASQMALDGGVTPEACLAAIEGLRGSALPPLVLMTYFNLLLQGGLDRSLARVKRAGIAGLIIPDLTPEAAREYRRTLDASGLDVVYLVAPTTADARLTGILRRSRGFAYLVSMTGVTGGHQGANRELPEFVARVRRRAGTLPLCIGFGISGPREAAVAAALSDGVIVGSALLRQIGDATSSRARIEVTGRFLRSLKASCRQPGRRGRPS